MEKKWYIALVLPLCMQAGPFYKTTNFQGFTGLINTPNAEVIDDGEVEFQFSNQVDAFRIRHEKDKYTAENYFVNIGLMPNLEFSGRLANIEYKDKQNHSFPFLDRDLSGSVKYQLPIYHEYLPHIAIGAQDIGGTGYRYKSKFIVMTQAYAFMQGSVGYGFSSNHLDGRFGGLEVRATEWLYLMGEYDTQDTRVGLRLNTPKKLFDLVDLSLTANKNINDTKEDISLALNFKIALGNNHENIEQMPQTCNVAPVDTTPSVVLKEPLVQQVTSETLKSRLQRFQEALVGFGFENLDLGMKGERIYVAYENNVLDHNELDAIGVILGYMVKYDLPYEKFELVIKKSNLPVRSVRGSLLLYKAFIKNLSQKAVKDFQYSVEMDSRYGNEPLRLFAENLNSSYFKTRIELAPGLKTFVATEVGVFDYLLSLRPLVHWNIYKGVDVTAEGDIPFLRSDNFKEGGALHAFDEGNKLRSAFIHKSDVFGGFVNTLSLGTYRDYLGGFDNMAYTVDNHTFGLKVGYLQDDSQDVDEREVYLGSYTYYDPTYDVFLTIGGGKYYNQDTGFDLKFKRFFGDTAVTLFYQNTSYEYAGIGVELPLTPRKVPDGMVQLKGDNDFSYSIRSSIRDTSGENTIKPSGAIDPQLAFNPRSRFLNRDRLSEDYLLAHILRLRDAYFTYVMDEGR